MKMPSLWSSADVADPFRSMRRELDTLFSDFARRWPNTEAGLQAPAIDIAETKESFEITAEIPGVEQNDIKLAIDGNRLVLSGEKKRESEEKDKNWHKVERSYGSFHRAVALPFEPKEDAVSAYFDKGVLRLSVKKPPAEIAWTKTIAIQSGAPPQTPAAPPKAA